MQLPVDIPAVFQIATDLKEVAKTPITISVLIDVSASGELAGVVRSVFSSKYANARVTIEYLSDEKIPSDKSEDMAVIVAGSSKDLGRLAQGYRKIGVPVMVVTQNLDTAQMLAGDSEYPVPEADIVLPVRVQSAVQKSVTQTLAHTLNISKKPDPKNDEDGNILLDEDAIQDLQIRMGEWIIAACDDKKLAFALAFPFVRRPLATDAVTSTSLQNGAIGFVPILPGADMPIMTLNQIKMVLQIATAYGQELDKSRIKEIVAVVAGGFICRNVVRSITKVVPFAGWIISGAVGYGATEAMGRAAMEYFEAGGDIVGLANVVQTARDAVVDVAKDVSKIQISDKSNSDSSNSDSE